MNNKLDISNWVCAKKEAVVGQWVVPSLTRKLFCSVCLAQTESYQQYRTFRLAYDASLNA